MCWCGIPDGEIRLRRLSSPGLTKQREYLNGATAFACVFFFFLLLLFDKLIKLLSTVMVLPFKRGIIHPGLRSSKIKTPYTDEGLDC